MKAKGKRKGKKSKGKSKGFAAESTEDGQTDGYASEHDDYTGDAQSDGGRSAGAASGQYDESYWQGDDGWTLAWVPSTNTWWSGDTWSSDDWGQAWYANEFSDADGTARSSLAYRGHSRERENVSSWRPNQRNKEKVFH